MRNYKYEDHWGNGRIAISMQPDVRDAPRSSTRPRTQQRCRLAAAHAKPATGCTVHHRKLPSQGKMSAKWISTYSLYIYYNICIYIPVITSGDENITQWPSGDLFPQPAPFSTASPAPCLAFEAHSSHSLHRSLQDRCQAFHQSLQALLQTSSVINLEKPWITHGLPMDTP